MRQARMQRLTTAARVELCALCAFCAVCLEARPALADPAEPAADPLAHAAISPTRSAPDQPAAFRRIGGVTLTGIGLFGLVLGGVYGARALVDKGDIGSHCDRALRCDLTGYTFGTEAKGSAVISTVSFAVGLASMAGGLTLLLWPASRASTAGSPGSKRRATAEAWLAPAPGGLALRMRW